MEADIAHTEVIHHRDPTIAACFDADRLDLSRYGTRIDPHYQNTDAAKRFASSGMNLKVS